MPKFTITRTVFLVPVGRQLPHVLLFQLEDIAKQWQRLRAGRERCKAPSPQKHESEHDASKGPDDCFVQHLPRCAQMRILPLFMTSLCICLVSR